MAQHPILCVPETLDPSLLLALSQAGYRLEQCASDAIGDAPTELLAALVSGRGGLGDALEACRAIRAQGAGSVPIVLLVNQVDVAQLADLDDLIDDFAILPSSGAELLVRLRRVTGGQDASGDSTIVSYGPLKINTETYQAVIADRTLDLTYMEYELLTFLASNPTKVFTRETLLSRVWGYEYYGGARTVDVHIRRLRAKLGEEHASLIETVRSVGYRLGQPSWGERTA